MQLEISLYFGIGFFFWILHPSVSKTTSRENSLFYFVRSQLSGVKYYFESREYINLKIAQINHFSPNMHGAILLSIIEVS